ILFPPALDTGVLDVRRKDSPEAIREAAGKFEALLVGQMLKSARESGSMSGLGGEEDQAAGSMFDMAEQHLAALIASQGVLGRARMMEKPLLGKPPRPGRGCTGGPPPAGACLLPPSLCPLQILSSSSAFSAPPRLGGEKRFSSQPATVT